MQFRGLRPQEEITKPDGKSFLLGSEVMTEHESCDYRDYLPAFESQLGTYFCTSMCTNFAVENQIVMLTKVKFGFEPNYSERFMAVTSGTQPGVGNYVSKALASPRIFGMVDEDICSWDRGQDVPMEQRFVEYIYREIKKDVLDIGKKWCDKWDYNWGWVQRTEDVSHKKLREALKISPISVTIALDKKDSKGVYQRTARAFHHCVTVIYVHDDGRVEILDHYENNKIRTLSTDFKIGWPAFITLNLKNMPLRLIKKADSPAIYYESRDKKTLCYIPGMRVLAMGAVDGLWTYKNDDDLITISEEEFNKYKVQQLCINYSLN